MKRPPFTLEGAPSFSARVRGISKPSSLSVYASVGPWEM